MAGNGTNLVFPAGNINNSETRRGELSAAPEIISEELAGLRGDALLTRALTLSLAARDVIWLGCQAGNHDWQSVGGCNAGCGRWCSCSVPVHECARCGDCDYGDNSDADRIREQCRDSQ